MVSNQLVVAAVLKQIKDEIRYVLLYLFTPSIYIKYKELHSFGRQSAVSKNWNFSWF